MRGELVTQRFESYGCRRVRRGELSIIKVRGEENVADCLTKHVERNNMEKYMSECGFGLRDGRHDLCPQIGDV